jgi:hypothetical protein
MALGIQQWLLTVNLTETQFLFLHILRMLVKIQTKRQIS